MTTIDAQISDAASLERGRLLFAGPCDFVWGAASLDDLPAMSLPEAAFLGRSNVGKSSLVNALTGRNALARVSNTPGRTRQLNFFDLGQRLMLVDMPGYGHAEASKAEIARWTAAIDTYLKGRATLRRLFLLIDARHGIKPNDEEMLGRLDRAAVVSRVVLTKVDKVKPPELDRVQAATVAALKRHPAAMPEPRVTSSDTKLGIAELRAEIADLADWPMA